MTPRISALTDEQFPASASPTLSAIGRALGMIPNLHRTLAHAPAALQAYTGMAAALANGVLDARLREQIAVATSAQNGCQYCASAHTMLGKGLGLSDEELTNNQRSDASDARAGRAAPRCRNSRAARKSVAGRTR